MPSKKTMKPGIDFIDHKTKSIGIFDEIMVVDIDNKFFCLLNNYRSNCRNVR